jgi:hypothetical protein
MTSLAVPGDENHVDAGRVRQWLGSTAKTPLLLAAAISCAIFWMLGNIADVPAERHFQASLLIQPSPIIAVLVAFVGLVGCSILLNVIEAAEKPEVPLFGAAAGLATLSWRGGTMTSVLQNSPLVVFPTLAAEVVLLGAIIFGCWYLLQRLSRNLEDPEGEELQSLLMCAATAALVMSVAMYFLSQTDAKKQVMAAVGISAFAGAAVAYSAFSVRWVGCYLAAPLLVGVAGYLLTYFSPGDWHIGRTGQPLAYPLPLDYASLGTVGSLFGFWTAQKWKHATADE